MRLIVGGRGQGKLALALQEECAENVAHCETAAIDGVFDKKIIYGLHFLVRRLQESGENSLDFILPRLREEHILICDEVGAGIVPMGRGERAYRDAVGGLCCEIAARADVVERVCCGIAQRVKG